MKKHYFLVLLLSSVSLFAQEDAWVYFKDKPSSQIYLDDPIKMLTQFSIDRRSNQNIALDNSDVPLELSYVNAIKNTQGITIIAKSKWLNSLHIQGSINDIKLLKNLDFVAKIEFADRTLNGTGKSIKSEKKALVASDLKVNVNYNYGNAKNQIEMLKGEILHQHNFTGAGQTIAVIDAGFPGVDTALPFKRLRDNNQILGGYDFIDRSENVYVTTKSSHGTQVLSTIGGFKEGSIVGTAPDASFYLFITDDDPREGPQEESWWVEAAEKADSLGVTIITTSLGYFGGYDNRRYNHTYSDMNGSTTYISRGAAMAFNKGIFVVAAAGNEGNSNEKHIGAPADAVNVLTVGAVNASQVKAGFSSVGPSYDNRIKPDVMAQGQLAYVSDQYGTIKTTNGTSFACPITAGLVACLWQALPNKTNKEIRDLIIASSDRYSLPNNQYGYGIPNFSLAATSVLSVADFTANDFLLYPNPTSSDITFLLPTNLQEGTVFIYSILGQLLLEQKITTDKNKISLDKLSKGVYFYRFEKNKFHKSGKIIKQ